MTDSLSSPELLEPKRIAAALRELPGWESDGDSIQRQYALPDFRSALAFVQFVGELSEARDHHPDIDIRYNRVRLALTTHSAGGLTEKDFELARMIDHL